MAGGNILERLAHAYNAFRDREEETRLGPAYQSSWSSSGSRPDAHTFTSTKQERSILASITTRISVDVASVELKHVRVDENDRYIETIDSGLNRCLNDAANIDQEGSQFRQDMAFSLIDQGVIAVVPVDTTVNPAATGGYDIRSLRVGRIVQWYPDSVLVQLYNEKVGFRQEVNVPKAATAIVENPFYNVMNETNSTLNRLVRKLNYLDAIDKQSSSGKLDLIIQLPYTIKSDARREGAERRRKELEEQLQGSRYGVAYADGSEKVTQLNRPAENNLLKQVQYLTEQLYNELGLTEEVMKGTADEKVMINYHNRTIEPILRAIAEGFRAKFLTQTARTQGQTIKYFRDPFKLIDINTIGDVADKMSRNEIMSPNEWRAILGLKPSEDPGADELRNKNIPEQKTDSGTEPVPAPVEEPEGDNQNGS